MSLRVAIDFSTLDTSGRQGGLFRYVVDLVRGLDAVAGADYAFLLIGSTPGVVEELRDVLEASPARWTYAHVAHPTVRGAYWIDHLRYWPILRRHKIDVFHGPHGFLPAVCPCRTVCTVPDLMREMFPEYADTVASRPYRIQRWMARHRATRLIAISQSTADDIARRWSVPPARIDVVPLGLSASFADSARRHVERRPVDPAPAPPPSVVTILSPYNLEPRKNLTGLLEAVALIRRTRHVRLALYGRAAWSPEREAGFADDVARLGLATAIDLLGILDDRALAEQYRACGLFVFPSLYEGFGYPVLEAMALGACVVARNVSAMVEVVGDAGVLIDTSDPKVMASAIEQIIDDPVRRAELVERASERAAWFSVDRLAHGTLRSYRSALGLHGPPGVYEAAGR